MTDLLSDITFLRLVIKYCIDIRVVKPIESVTVPKSERITKEIEILSDEDKQAVKKECVKPLNEELADIVLDMLLFFC